MDTDRINYLKEELEIKRELLNDLNNKFINSDHKFFEDFFQRRISETNERIEEIERELIYIFTKKIIEPKLDRDLDLEEEPKEMLEQTKLFANTFEDKEEPVNVEFKVIEDKEYKHLQLALEFITFMVAIVCVSKIITTILEKVL